MGFTPKGGGCPPARVTGPSERHENAERAREHSPESEAVWPGSRSGSPWWSVGDLRSRWMHPEDSLGCCPDFPRGGRAAGEVTVSCPLDVFHGPSEDCELLLFHLGL